MSCRILYPLLLLFFVSSCDSEIVHPSSSEKNNLKVVFFLNPECPLCRSYSRTIVQLQEEFNSGIKWEAVFPGKWICKDSVSSFISFFQLRFDTVIMDADLVLTEYYKANITPSVFVIDAGGDLQYSGRIDDWAIEPGKKKLKPERNDLKDALHSLLTGNEVIIKETTPIGCLIE